MPRDFLPLRYAFRLGCQSPFFNGAFIEEFTSVPSLIFVLLQLLLKKSFHLFFNLRFTTAFVEEFT
jgi:hypothetical protein